MKRFKRAADAIIFSNKSNKSAEEAKLEKEEWEVVENKDFSNGEALRNWLELAKKIIEKNFQATNNLLTNKNKWLGQIRKYEKDLDDLLNDDQKSDDEKKEKRSIVNDKIDYTKILIEQSTKSSAKYLEENNFLCKELENLQGPLFLKERKEKVQATADNQEQQAIAELENVLADNEEEIGKLKEKINSMKYSAEAIEISEIDLKEEIKEKRKSQSFSKKTTKNNMNDTTNNKKDNLIKLQTKWSEYLDSGSKDNFFYSWEKNEETMKDLLPFIEGALQNNDLKDGYQQLLNEWNNKEWKDWSGERSSLQYYLNSWDKLEEKIGGEDLTPEQQKELEAFQTIKDTLKIDEAGDLTEQLNNLQEEIKNAKEAEIKLESYKNSLELVNKELEAAKKEKEELDKKRQEWSDQITKLVEDGMAEKNYYEEEIAKLEEQLTAKEEEKDESLAEKIEEISKLNLENQKYKSLLIKREKEKDILNKEVKKLKAELEGLKTNEEGSKGKIDLLEKEKEEISRKLQELENKEEELKKKIEEIQKLSNEKDQKHEELVLKFAGLSTKRERKPQSSASNLPAARPTKEDSSTLKGYLREFILYLEEKVELAEQASNAEEEVGQTSSSIVGDSSSAEKVEEETEVKVDWKEAVQQYKEKQEKIEAFIEQKINKWGSKN